MVMVPDGTQKRRHMRGCGCAGFKVGTRQRRWWRLQHQNPNEKEAEKIAEVARANRKRNPLSYDRNAFHPQTSSPPSANNEPGSLQCPLSHAVHGG